MHLLPKSLGIAICCSAAPFFCSTAHCSALPTEVAERISLRIDRVAQGPASGDLGAEMVQQIGFEIGLGRFDVHAAPLSASPEAAGTPRVFFVASSPFKSQQRSSVKRIYLGGGGARPIVVAGGDAELLATVLNMGATAAELTKLDDAAIERGIAVALYEGAALPCRAETQQLSTLEVAQRKACADGQRKELDQLGLDPVRTRTDSGSTIWQGRYLLGDGGVEDVVVSLPGRLEAMLSVERRQIRPAGYFPAIDQPPPSTEIWVITEETGWQAPKRLQLMAAMAAMGNAKSRYQLGVALIGEPDPVARAEGVRWLQLAAAAGNTDAKILIEAAGDDARSDRDRDLDRVHRHVTAGNSRGR